MSDKIQPSDVNLTLYGRDETGSAAIEALLVEAGIGFNLVNVPGNAASDAASVKARDEFRVLNPMGQVPALHISPKSGGFKIFMTESAAIMLWLGDLYRDHMEKAGFYVPSLDDTTRPDYLRWMFFFATEHYQTHLFYAYAARWTNHPDHESAQKSKALAALERHLNIIEQRLGVSPYFFGDKPSPVDFYAAMLFGWHPEIGKFPRAAALMKRMAARSKSSAIWQKHKIG